MPLYIAIPVSDNLTPQYVVETSNGDYSRLTLYSSNQQLSDQYYDETTIENYKIYVTSDSFSYADINDYVNSTQMFLHDNDNSEYIGSISALSYGNHYWTPVGVGYIYDISTEVLIFGNHQTVKTYNNWVEKGTNAWEIYVNLNNQFIEQRIDVTSGYTYTFSFRTYSEDGYDGIIFSTTQLTSGSINGSGNARCSGPGATATYTYTPSSNGYVYVYFKTDSSTFEGPDDSSSETYGEFSYSYAQGATRTITLDRTWGDGGSSSVTISSGSYTGYPSITKPSRSGGTFIGYFSAANGGTKYYDTNSGWVTNIPSSVSTLYAHWYNNIQDTLYTSMSKSYSPTGRWEVIGGSVAETLDEIESIVIDEYGSYELGFEVRYDPPSQVSLYIPGSDITPGTYNLRFIITSSDNTSSGVYSTTATHSFTLTVTKASQAAPTTVTGNSSIYATSGSISGSASGGGGQGTLMYKLDASGGTNYGTATSTAPSRNKNSVGTTTFVAYWSGNNNYNKSPDSSQGTLVITKATAPPTFSNTTVYADLNPTNFTTSPQVNCGAFTAATAGHSGGLTYTLGTVKNSSNTTVSGWSMTSNTSRVIRVPASTPGGTYTATVTVTEDATSNYNSGTATATITIIVNKKDQVAPTATGDTKPYATSGTISGSASGGGCTGNTINYKSDTNGGTSYGSATTTAPTRNRNSVGTTSFIAFWPGNNYWNASSNSSQAKLIITKADQSAPTATGASVTYPATATATASGGGGQGTLEWSNGSYRSAVGSQTTKARWSGNSNYNPSPWSSAVTLTVSAPSAPSFTMQGGEDDYGATVYAQAKASVDGTVYWGTSSNNMRSISSVSANTWENLTSRTAIGSTTIYAYFVPDDANYPNVGSSSSPGAQCTITISDYITNSNYNPGDYYVNISIVNKSALKANGGSSSVSVSAGHYAYDLYASGTYNNRHLVSDSATWSITTNGNSRFSKSGNTLNHSNMTTNVATDTVVVTGVNSNSTSTKKTDTASVSNSITNPNYDPSGYTATIEIQNKDTITADAWMRRVIASASHLAYNYYTSGSRDNTKHTVDDDVTWDITTNGNSRFYKTNYWLGHRTMLGNLTTDTVVVTATNSSYTSATATDTCSVSNNVTDVVILTGKGNYGLDTWKRGMYYGDTTQLTVNAKYSSGYYADVTDFSTLTYDSTKISMSDNDTIYMYVDSFDFGEYYGDIDAWSNDYNGCDFDEYIKDVLRDPEAYGANKYVYTGETIRYNGGVYYLWEYIFSDDHVGGSFMDKKQYILTTTIDLDVLEEESLSIDYTSGNPYNNMIILNYDLKEIYTNVSDEKYIIYVGYSHA